jgi:diguanylate cyclase (GGDEF)-like protein
MNKEQIKKIVIGLSIIIFLSSLVYYFLNREDKNTTLSLLDRQWIESNKNKVFDFSIPTNVPVFNVDGSGLIFDFISDFEKDTKLSFNKTTYGSGVDLSKVYSLEKVGKLRKNDLLLVKDNYVLVSLNEEYYPSLNSIKDLKIGVLEDYISTASLALSDVESATYKPYASYDLMIEDLDVDVTHIIIPRVIFLEKLMTNQLYINYNIYDMNDYYVIGLSNEERLNTIITKYFKKWYEEKFELSYNRHFTSNYFKYNNIDSKTRAKFRSKRYIYGLVSQLPYDGVVNNSLVGYNSTLLKDFSKLADVEIIYKSFNSKEALFKAFDANDLDLYYDNLMPFEHKGDFIKTVDIFDNHYVVLLNSKKDALYNNLNSLSNLKVAVLKDSYLNHIINPYNEQPILARDIKELSNSSLAEVVIIDYQTYVYNKSMFNNYGLVKIVDIENHSFILRDVSSNEIFNDYFKFFTTYVNRQEVIKNASLNMIEKNQLSLSMIIFNLFGYVLFFVTFGYLGYNKYFKVKKRKEVSLTKGDKLKYVDMLTSLKNRNYLNDNIEKWDRSNIYPQAVIVIDLNNIAYINDNYGYQEGDRIIAEAANILINNQIDNSEIIRTDGNEFLIYMVGHDERQVILYMRKLNKELKDLDHGFGAALGYSMVLDEIKTIDDAINEAATEMRENKEEE